VHWIHDLCKPDFITDQHAWELKTISCGSFPHRIATRPPVQDRYFLPGIKRQTTENDHSPSDKVKNAWSYTSTPSRLHGVDMPSSCTNGVTQFTIREISCYSLSRVVDTVWRLKDHNKTRARILITGCITVEGKNVVRVYAMQAYEQGASKILGQISKVIYIKKKSYNHMFENEWFLSFIERVHFQAHTLTNGRFTYNWHNTLPVHVPYLIAI